MKRLQPHVRLVLLVQKMGYATTEPLLRREARGWIVTSAARVVGRFRAYDAEPGLTFNPLEATGFAFSTIEQAIRYERLKIEPSAWNQHKRPIEYRITDYFGSGR
ncbi:hypothetical protein D869_gp114 [Caulobacter phage CcrRogue]|uniref:Uncharacterized protein n=1 Tax=Caulobacter phage CcrRogue TaxID=2927986 RepID=K4JR83_9CAUD|nr:hypothetical protein D869_gp114 [Caulobacter phage CcrRogue]AFU86800.1 hypothetical protein CcrRogue_gp318 [Caulobacter phage CcrRogue]